MLIQLCIVTDIKLLTYADTRFLTYAGIAMYHN